MYDPDDADSWFPQPLNTGTVALVDVTRERARERKLPVRPFPFGFHAAAAGGRGGRPVRTRHRDSRPSP